MSPSGCSNAAGQEIRSDVVVFTRNPEVDRSLAREARYDAIVQKLREREEEDRAGREKRQRFWYRQTIENEPAAAGSSSPWAPARLGRFRTRVPCCVSPEARALLAELKRKFPAGAVTFPHLPNGRQAVMLSRGPGAAPRQIGWVEHCVQADPMLCNVRHQGLSVETDGGTMLVLRFRYPATSVRMSAKPAGEQALVAASVEFTEILAALDQRPSDKVLSPRLVWVTRPEGEALTALGSRDYETFYLRFKLEVQAGLWSALSGLLALSPGSQWHAGSCYTVVREPDATNRRIHQRTVDDCGRAADIGLDRVYDAAAATDILLLYLEGDLLADFADLYFALHRVSSSEGTYLKEEFFATVRRFWAGAQSLASRFGSDLAAVMRMALRAVPMPAQVPLVKQDWAALRQALVDRYGEGGRKVHDLVRRDLPRPRLGAPGWPFATYPAGEVNIGLRLVHRQEWRYGGTERGEIIRTVVRPAKEPGAETSEPGEQPANLDEVLGAATRAAVEDMKWPLDFEGSINTGLRGMATRSDMGLEAECRESARDTSARLSDLMRRTVTRIRDEDAAGAEQPAPSTDMVRADDEDVVTYLTRRMQTWYDVLTRPAELQNVVLVAEKLPAPAEIDLGWVRRHAGILAKVLLDETLRASLATIGQERADEEREHLYEHIRANVLHYQRAIWQREDPQQRSMRYRKSGKKVPLEWRFELEWGAALTAEELGERLAAANVDGQFVAYAAGPEADLDQVIDPAGPVGFYANYAVYHMRPEFGGAELFAMLHFFKSPWLRPHPQTGEPEVADPEEIRIAGDRSVMEAFRRERTRRLALHGVAVDVVGRAAEPCPAEPACPAEGYQLILESGRSIALLAAPSQREPEPGWALLTAGAERVLRLLAGGGGEPVRSGAPEAEALVVVRDSGERTLRLSAGDGAVPAQVDGEKCVIARIDGKPAPSVSAGTARAPADEPIIGARLECVRPCPVTR